MREGKPGFPVPGIDGNGLVLRPVPFGAVDAPGPVPAVRAADMDLLALRLGLVVVEAGMVQTEAGGAAGHGEAVLERSAPVLLVVGVEAGHALVLDLVAIELLLERHLGHVA